MVVTIKMDGSQNGIPLLKVWLARRIKRQVGFWEGNNGG
jgi:hypothetical protein